MSTAVALPTTFEEKLMGRIKDSIGELMTDDDLKRLVERGVEKALFEPKIIQGRYGSTSHEECLVDRAVKQFLQTRMNEAVDAWITTHPEVLQKAVEDAIKLGVGGCLIAAMDNRFNWIFSNLSQQILNQHQQR